MAGASTALCSPAIQSPSSFARHPAADCLPRAFSISRLHLPSDQHPSLLRVRTQAPSSSACFHKVRICFGGLQFKGLHLSKSLGFSLAASSDDSASVSSKVTEGDPVGEGLSKEENRAVEDAVAGKDGVLKSETSNKDDNSEPADKFKGVLKDTTEELKQRAEKARAALAATAQETAAALGATAQETAEKSKENLSYIAENAPDPIREIADTALKAHSADTPKKFAKIHDFCLGIPYGSFLVIGGLLWFIISGSTAPIRFGVILGGILLGLSITSLSAWKEGKPTATYIIGQAAISSILALRQIRRLFEVKAIFPAGFTTLVSAGMVGFYCYVLLAGGNPPSKKTKHAPAM